MYRDRERAPGPRSKGTSARPSRRASEPVLSLQEAVGNRAFGQMLARDAAKKPTVKIGKFSIEVAGNTAEWLAAKDAPESLDVTSQKGKHSAELARLFKEGTKIKLLTLTVPAGNESSGQHLDMGSVAIEIKNGRITSYSVDGKTESWQVAGFDGVHRTKVTRKVGAG
jgi:hypothetical protein